MPFTAQFHVYSVNDTVTAANLNGNISQIITQGNAIDNTFVGAAGFFGSQIIPTTAGQATFGGSGAGLNYTFPQNLAITGTTTAAAEIDMTGTTVTAGQVAIGGDAGGTQGMLLNVPTGSTNGLRAQVNGVTQFQVTTGTAPTTIPFVRNGVVAASPTINAVTTAGPLAPGYTVAGATLGGTFHVVTGTAVFTAATSVTVTLTNNAVFTSGTTYVVFTDNGTGTWPLWVSGNSGVIFQVDTKTATSFRIVAANPGLNTPISGSGTVPWVAIGT
jgi:hypothetical protein